MKQYSMHIVSCNVMGGLGNQLFQIMTCISYGLEHRRKIVIPYYDKSPGVTQRPTYWNNLLKPFVVFTNKNKDNQIPNKISVYKELQFSYDKIPEYDTSLYLVGYFQSYMYFDNNKNKILQMLRFDNRKKEIHDLYKNYFDGVINDICSVHFRLGDYKHLQDCHPMLSIDYYISAMTKLCETTNISRVLYFCQEQDNNIVEQHIQTIQYIFPHVEFIKVSDDICDWEQMVLMALCNHHIIANSTFSWWGAYLSSSPKKKVFYPSVWFGPKLSNHNVDHLCPCEWENI